MRRFLGYRLLPTVTIHLDGLPLAVFDPGAIGCGPALDLIMDNSDTGVRPGGRGPFVSAKGPKPLALGVIWKIPSMLAESSGGQTRLAQTVPALFRIRLRVVATPNGPTSGMIQSMPFQILPLVLLVQHASGSTDILVNQQQPSSGL